MADEMKRIGRKLLIASLGVASVSYGACGGRSSLAKDAAPDGVVADGGSESLDASTGEASDTHDGPFGNPADASIDRQFIGNLI